MNYKKRQQARRIKIKKFKQASYEALMAGLKKRVRVWLVNHPFEDEEDIE